MKNVHLCFIIDDDPIFIYGTKRIMNEVGFSENIVVYNNGQEAIDGLKEISEAGALMPDVIFLDLNMPIMNGWEFLEEYNNLPNHNSIKAVIYIISSSIDPRDLERVKNYSDVRNYILKPITPNNLVDILGATKTKVT